MYDNWWVEKMSSIDNKKLGFFFRYKKTFKFEQYLDTLPRHIRIYTTRLRTSSHIFPIEILRYSKPKVEAKDRKCNICDLDVVGDEHHYLAKCSNINISSIRCTFMNNIRQALPIFETFNQDCIIEYCLMMHDPRIISIMAKYIKTIYTTFKDETNGKKVEPPKNTRCGRLIKKPNKLDL